jgi:hypothetical protein
MTDVKNCEFLLGLLAWMRTIKWYYLIILFKIRLYSLWGQPQPGDLESGPQHTPPPGPPAPPRPGGCPHPGGGGGGGGSFYY